MRTLAAYWALTKPGITRLVLFTCGVGFWLGARGHPDLRVLLALLLGSGLVVGGTNALNEWWERDADARMRRTRRRPLPAGTLRPAQAFAFGTMISALGIALLVTAVNLTTAVLAAAALFIYILAYTPLKRRSPVALYVGAVAGALPIMGGWTASGAPITAAGSALFAILFLWQLPHFLALGWLYREDYRNGGFVMLSARDLDGRRSARRAAAFAFLLLIASLAPTWTGLAATPYLVAALVLGGALIAWSLALVRTPDALHARRLFLASVVYLPLLLVLLVLLPR